MKMFTLKLKPKMIFGIILAVTGIAVIVLTFVSNHINQSESVAAVVSASTDEERRNYLATFGWEVQTDCEEKEITIPQSWNQVYSDYNEIQKNQGFDLSDYKGKKVTLYTYKISNYDETTEEVVADMLVYNGLLIGGDLCNTSAENGFLVGFSGE